jgi:hypothetical protein
MSKCDCGKPATHFVGSWGHLNRCCEACADGMIACKHETMTRSQSFDTDGCGYYLSTCDYCGYIEPDDMP